MTHLKGILVDANLAVIPKVKVTLEERKGSSFADVAALSTGVDGRFDFGDRKSGFYRMIFQAQAGFCRMSIPVDLSQKGWKGMRITLPVAVTDSCPQDCEDRLKLDEMS